MMLHNGGGASHCHCSPHLVDGQIDAGVGDDAQKIGNVALEEGLRSLLLQDLLGTVKHPRVLSGLPQGQTGLHHLRGRGGGGKAVSHPTSSFTITRKPSV